MGPRAGLEGRGKSRPHRDSIPGPSSPYRVAIPTTLSGLPKAGENRNTGRITHPTATSSPAKLTRTALGFNLSFRVSSEATNFLILDMKVV